MSFIIIILLFTIHSETIIKMFQHSLLAWKRFCTKDTEFLSTWDNSIIKVIITFGFKSRDNSIFIIIIVFITLRIGGRGAILLFSAISWKSSWLIRCIRKSHTFMIHNDMKQFQKGLGEKYLVGMNQNPYLKFLRENVLLLICLSIFGRRP